MNMTMFRTVLTALVATLWLAAMGESRPAQSPDATTTTFTYTATERLSRFEFDGISNIVSPVRGDRNRVRGRFSCFSRFAVKQENRPHLPQKKNGFRKMRNPMSPKNSALKKNGDRCNISHTENGLM